VGRGNAGLYSGGAPARRRGEDGVPLRVETTTRAQEFGAWIVGIEETQHGADVIKGQCLRDGIEASDGDNRRRVGVVVVDCDSDADLLA
jgi:hypothetical protein